MSLTDRQVEEFFDTGFTILPKVFNADEIRQATACFENLVTRARSLTETSDVNGARFVINSGHIQRVIWCGGVEPFLRTMGCDERLVRPASQLLGSLTLDHLICQAHFKLPNDNVSFDWHQDSQHRRYGTEQWIDLNGRGSYVQTIVAIDEMTSDNGPIFVVPKSCRLGHLSEEQQKKICDYFDPNDAIAMLLPPGSVALVGPYTIHGSFPNESEHARRVLINGYCFPDANRRVYPGSGTGVRIEL